jgi:hypothetical protein
VAPVLLCPECGAKHPLDGIGSRSAFPCSGCGRTLKVPAVAHAATEAPLPSVPPPPIDELPWPVASAPVVGAATMDPHATQAFSTASVPPLAPPTNGQALVAPLPPPEVPAPEVPPATGGRSSAAADDLVPARPIRFLLWIVAVPLGFIIVFWLAKAVGVLNTNQVTDVALANGWGRFWPIVRLLPFVALATAGIVQGGVYGIARLRAKRRRPAAAPVNAEIPRARHSSRNGK